jgi:hypothetical protein
MGVQKFKRGVVAPSFTGSVPAADIPAGSVKLAKLAVFTANAQTGTGSSQNIAHGLGVTPTFVVAVPTDGGTVSYGTHTSTNVVVTVTSTKKFDVIAFL